MNSISKKAIGLLMMNALDASAMLKAIVSI